MTDRLYEGVRTASSGTPYAVQTTDDGFEVTLDVVDAEWYGVLNKAGLSKVWTWHVRVDGDTYSITDESRTVEWVAGAPRIAGSVEVFKGRKIEFGSEKIWAFDEHGRFGRVADYKFDSREGRDLIEGVAGQLGMKQKRGPEERIALFFAALAIGGLVIGGIVVAVLALAGVL